MMTSILMVVASLASMPVMAQQLFQMDAMLGEGNTIKVNPTSLIGLDTKDSDKKLSVFFVTGRRPMLATASDRVQVLSVKKVLRGLPISEKGTASIESVEMKSSAFDALNYILIYVHDAGKTVCFPSKSGKVVKGYACAGKDDEVVASQAIKTYEISIVNWLDKLDLQGIEEKDRTTPVLIDLSDRSSLL